MFKMKLRKATQAAAVCAGVLALDYAIGAVSAPTPKASEVVESKIVRTKKPLPIHALITTRMTDFWTTGGRINCTP